MTPIDADNIDFTTLLGQAGARRRQAGAPGPRGLRRGSRTLKPARADLHQVQGTLRMVELYGAAMVVEEMEQLAPRCSTKIADRSTDEAYAVLMRGIVQLPDYLERLQSGHRDIPIVLLPLLNDLRAARGEKRRRKRAVLAGPRPPAARGPADAAAAPEPPLKARQQLARCANWRNGRRQCADQHRRHRAGDRRPARNADHEGRAACCGSPAVATACAMVRCRDQALRQAFGRVDREARHVVDGDVSRPRDPRRLTRKLLYFVAHTNGAQRTRRVARHLRPRDAAADRAELAHARGSSSPARTARCSTPCRSRSRKTCCASRTRSTCTCAPRSDRCADLPRRSDVLDRVADTLGMLGLGVPRRVVQEQRSADHDVVSGQRKADEGALLDIAGALLYVEAVARRPGSSASAARRRKPTTALPCLALRPQGARRAGQGGDRPTSPQAQARPSSPSSNRAGTTPQLHDVPRLLDEVSGAMRILELAEPAAVPARDPPLHGSRTAGAQARAERRSRWTRWPTRSRPSSTTSRRCATTAPNRDKILEVDAPEPGVAGLLAAARGARRADRRGARSPSTTARARPVTAERAPRAATARHRPHRPRSSPSPEPAPAPVAAAPHWRRSPHPRRHRGRTAIAGFEGERARKSTTKSAKSSSRSSRKKSTTSATCCRPGAPHPHNAEKLRPIRRVFHTLKGSGRLVGAQTLGRVQLEDREPAQPRARRQPSAPADQCSTWCRSRATPAAAARRPAPAK